MMAKAKRILDRWPVAVWAMIVGILVGTGGILIVGRTHPQHWVVFGGNTDPGDGNCGGAARDQFVAAGWVSGGNICQVQWQADIGQNTRNETNAAMPAAHDIYNRFCGGDCIVAGFSLGNTPALQLAAETGHPTSNIYLFGAPQPSTGIFHNPYVRNPLVQFWTDFVGGLDQNQTAPAGAKAFFDTHDPYANGGTQCGGPGWFGINIPGHYIINTAQANEHVWTGPDGVQMHEANYVAQPGVPVSGSDPEPWWSLCPPSLDPGQIPTIPPNMPAVPGVPVGG